MGFLRKTLFLGTGGLSGAAGIKANSKTERAAKAAEKQVRIQKQMLKLQQQAAHTAPAGNHVRSATDRQLRYDVKCPHCSGDITAPAGDDVVCPECQRTVRITPQGRSAIVRLVDTPPAPAPAPTAAASSLSEELERLAALHSRGLLSAEEFEAAKRKLLA